jgi:hypothetical protein
MASNLQIALIPMHERVFYLMAHIHLTIVFMIILILSLLRGVYQRGNRV